eukprot:SAG11_NODE_4135_length_2035_cov_3.433419_2_plen_70_part_00
MQQQEPDPEQEQEQEGAKQPLGKKVKKLVSPPAAVAVAKPVVVPPTFQKRFAANIEQPTGILIDIVPSL